MNAWKRILTVGLIVLFHLFLFAQNGNHSANVIKQRLDSTILFNKYEKIEYFYDDSGNNSASITYEWSTTNKKFEQSLNTEFTYNLKGHCILSQQTKWDKTSSQWLLDDKTEFSYDDKDQLLSSTYFIWNELLNNWELTTKTNFGNSYDGNGKLIRITASADSKTLNTTAVSKYDYIFNSNGTLLSVFRFDMNIDSLRPADKDEYTYDTDGNLTTSTSSTFHNRWHLIGTEEFTFNTVKDASQLIIPQDYGASRLLLPVDYFYGCIITSQTHAYGSNIWTKMYYYSSIEVTSLKDQQALNTAVFPNPATDYLNIQWKGNQAVLTVELFDVTGNKIFAGKVGNHSKLAIQTYPKGLCLVKLSDNHQTIKTEKVYFY